MNHILSEYFIFYLQIDFIWNASRLYFCMSLWYNHSLWERWGSSIQPLELVSRNPTKICNIRKLSLLIVNLQQVIILLTPQLHSISCISQVVDNRKFDGTFLLKLKIYNVSIWYQNRTSWICLIDFKSSFEANFWTVFTNGKTVLIYIPRLLKFYLGLMNISSWASEIKGSTVHEIVTKSAWFGIFERLWNFPNFCG